MTSARFFHGTIADLAPGDTLVPGTACGKSVWSHSGAYVYAVTSDFDPRPVEGWAGAPDTPDNRLSYAIDQAEQWAAYAADVACADPAHHDPGHPYECTCQTDENDECACEQPNEFHVECQREGLLPACLRIYEVEPIGPIEPDPSTDVDAGVRMSAARIIRAITPAEKPPWTGPDADEA